MIGTASSSPAHALHSSEGRLPQAGQAELPVRAHHCHSQLQLLLLPHIHQTASGPIPQEQHDKHRQLCLNLSIT